MRYLLRHVLLCDAVYDMQLRAHRRELHLRAAAAIEALHADALAPYYADLAYHYGQAEAWERAAHYALLAGRAAYGMSDYRQARAFFTQALDCTPAEEAGRRARLLIELGRTHSDVGDYALATECLRSGLAAAHAVGDVEAAVEALEALSRVETFAGTLERARALGEEALALARQTDNPRAIARATHRLSQVAFFQGDYEAVGRWAEETLPLAQALGDRPLMALSRYSLGLCAYKRRDWGAAARCYQDSLALWQEIGGRPGIGDCLSSLGNVAVAQGDLAAGARYHRASLAISREIGKRADLAIDLFNVGDLYARMNQPQEASAYYREALLEAWAVGSVWVALAALIGLAEVLAWQGRSLQAAEWVGLAFGHPMSNREVVQSADRALATLRTSLGAEELEGALERGRTLDLEEIVGQILRGGDVLGGGDDRGPGEPNANPTPAADPAPATKSGLLPPAPGPARPIAAR